MAVPDTSFQTSDLFPGFEPYSYIEDVIFSATDENLAEVIEQINKSPVPKNYIAFTIMLSANVTRFKFKLYRKLYESLGDQVPPTPVTFFIQYLSHLKVVPRIKVLGSPLTNMPVEKMEEPFEENSFEYFIKNDDLESIIEDLSKENLTCVLDDKIMTPLNLAAYCGSTKIFKFLVLNHAEADLKTAKYAVRGGSLEIIEYCHTNDISLNNTVKFAVKMHRHSICDWLFKQYEPGDIDLAHSIKYCNSIAICVLIKRNYKLEYKKVMSPLHLAAVVDHVPLAKLLLDKGCKIEIRCGTGMTPLLQAAYANAYHVGELLLEKGASIRTRDKLGNDLEYYARFDGMIQVYKKYAELKKKKEK